MASDGAVTYARDARGRLVSTTSTAGAVYRSFDAAGRLLTRTEVRVVTLRGRAVVRAREERYVRDVDGVLLAVLEGDGRKRPRLARVYIHAGGPLPLAVVEGNGTRGSTLYWYTRDALGSARVATDGDGVAGAWSDFSAYGLERDDHGAMPGARDEAWAGHGGDDLHGARDFGARAYLPDFYRFDGPDRAAWGTPGRPASFNRHAYVEGNPLKYVDPTGNFLFLAPLAFVAIDVAVGVGSSAFIASAAVTVMEVGLVTASFAGGWTVGSALAGNDADVQEGQAGFEASIQLAVVGGMALDANIALRDGKVAIDYAATSFKSRPLPVQPGQLPGFKVSPAAGGAHGHHSDPKFGGGDPSQPLTRLPSPVHKSLHRDMNDFLHQRRDAFGNHMRPQRGNSGPSIQRNFTRKERLEALGDFYTQFGTRHPEAARDFFRQHPSLVKAP